MKTEDKQILETEVLEDVTSEWEKPLTCPMDPTLLQECDVCQ